jgi:hypothetical protein
MKAELMFAHALAVRDLPNGSGHIYNSECTAWLGGATTLQLRRRESPTDPEQTPWQCMRHCPTLPLQTWARGH